MQPGDPVTLVSDRAVKATIIRLPRSEGRNRPRVLIKTDQGVEMWVHVDELMPLEAPSENS